MWRPEDLATIGELLLDISANLAQTYGLTYEEIEKSLPLIDTSKTLIREVCPAYLSNVECRPGKYRRYDGLCTNLQNPTWGATLSPFARLMSPRFADGLTAPRISVTGRDLPLSRVVSRTMHPDDGFHDHAGTVMVIAWGQFMDHDYTLTGTPLDPLNRNDPEECCGRPPHLKNPYCNEILIPEDDYFYRLFNVHCMDFVRAFPAVRPGCRLGSRVPFNLLTGVLDANTVYGITEAFARKLRTGYGGLLRMNPVFSEYGLKDLLPLKLDIPDEGCTRPNRSMYCFEAGEIRVNEQLVLTCMHTLLAREHNRLAKALAIVNPHWDDEILFQEARRIVIAEIQHITYNEFLPILLGKDVMEKFGLLLEKENYWNGYDPNINPGVIDAFAAAAFRFGHSLLPTAVERWSKAHKFIASKRLSDLIRRPYDLYRAGVFDEYFMGLMNQVAQAMDDSITQEVTNHLFKKVGAKFGMDLVSFNMQRGREFGIPSYMEFRKYCGLPEANTFEELFGSMPNETVRRYSTIFEHPADVDLWSGGVSERPLPGSMLGPTFACLIATQFSHSRRGDRFWYELPNQPSSFTLEQLNEIRKTKLSRLICDNTDLIDTIQIYPMVLPDHEINPRVPCRSGILPSIDLSKWADFPATSHATQYDAILKKSAQTASEIKPVLQRIYINKFNHKSKDLSMGKHTANNLKKKPNKLWWAYPRHAKWKTIAQSLEMPKKMLQLQEKSLNELIMLPKFSPINDQNRNINLSPDMEIVKITTIVEAIRQKRERNAQISEATKNIQRIIGNKRLKRSSHESRYNPMITTDSWHDRGKKTFTSNKRAPYPKSHYRDQQKESLPTRKRAVDLKVANNIAIPSTVFYKRIWEYINGTRPHSDIISDYSFLKNNSENNNSTCTDKDRITASQSQKNYLQMTSSTIKPEQEFYKRIWDIINATQSTYENTKTRSKRNANIPKSDTSTQLCVQGRKANYAEDKQLQAINDKVALDTAETINSREISDPYISSFWNFTNNTQWQPKTTIPIVNTIKLNNDLISSPNVNTASASEVADLNKFPDNAETNIDYLSSDNSTKYEKRNKSQNIITEPRPPYSSQEQENSTISSSSPIEHTTDNNPEKEDQTKYTKDYLINATPIYDPLNIPYVDVPDYTDQQEDSLDKDNQNSTAANYKVYDDSDYVDFERHNPDEFSSKSPSAEIKILQNIQTGNNEPEVSLNVSHSRCTENKDSIECTDKYDVEDTELLNNTETSGDVQRSIEDSVESMLSNERKNSTTDFVDFDINEYRKPFNLDDFIKNDPIFESIRTTNSKENTKHNGKENPADRSEESEEFEIYATVPKEESYNYFKKNGNYDDGIIYDDRDDAKKNIHSSTEEKAEDSDVISEDHYHYDDKDFLKHIFGENNDKESSESVDTEDEFLSRYFTKDILDQLRDNSTAEEERQKEESRNREEIHNTLSRILDKKDRFSRLDENLDKMIKEGETIPIRYKNFWSLEYESPHKKNEAIEETETET
ncbi:chorion peroxidase [Lasius niger]|uniref:Chorion peroxidase n=1 Tax=Lasius niger TaxID=67767 RepID=A0A0J7L2M7_LASNI|nr:chorion peroxidase [Lasius niger]